MQKKNNDEGRRKKPQEVYFSYESHGTREDLGTVLCYAFFRWNIAKVSCLLHVWTQKSKERFCDNRTLQYVTLMASIILCVRAQHDGTWMESQIIPKFDCTKGQGTPHSIRNTRSQKCYDLDLADPWWAAANVDSNCCRVLRTWTAMQEYGSLHPLDLRKYVKQQMSIPKET